MAVKSREELLEVVKKRVDGDTSEDAVMFVEDITDTYDDLVSKVSESGDWENKYKELAQKYKERFFEGKIENDPDDNTDPDPEDYTKLETYEDLFKEVKEDA